MNKARTGINSNKQTNNVSKNCGGVKKAGSANPAYYTKIHSNVIVTRAPPTQEVKCDTEKHLSKLHIRYSY
jgi:hypothetical protein